MILFAVVHFSPASATDAIVVIVSGNSPDYSIQRVKLRDIYLKKIFLDDSGQPFIPVNLPPGNPLRRSVTEILFNKTIQQLQNYWNQRYFQGIAPPYVLDSQEAVVQFVAKTPGAIGYIASCRLDARVKPVLTLPIPLLERDDLEKLCPPEGKMNPSN